MGHRSPIMSSGWLSYRLVWLDLLGGFTHCQSRCKEDQEVDLMIH